MSGLTEFDQLLDAANRRQAVTSGNRGFTTVAIYLLRWLKLHDIDRDCGRPIKMTIEVPDADSASAMIYALKSEHDLMTIGLSTSIDLDQPFKLVGIEFTFKIAKSHTRSYVTGEPK